MRVSVQLLSRISRTCAVHCVERCQSACEVEITAHRVRIPSNSSALDAQQHATQTAMRQIASCASAASLLLFAHAVDRRGLWATLPGICGCALIISCGPALALHQLPCPRARDAATRWMHQSKRSAITAPAPSAERSDAAYPARCAAGALRRSAALRDDGSAAAGGRSRRRS